MPRKKKKSADWDEYLPEIDNSIKRSIFVIIIFLLAILSLLSIFDLAGVFGRYFYQILKSLLGWGFWTAPLVLFALFYLLLFRRQYRFTYLNWIGCLILILGYSGFFHLWVGPEHFKEVLGSANGGGYVGYGIAWQLYNWMGRWAAMAVVLTMIVAGVILMFNTPLENLLAHLSLKNTRERLGQLSLKLRHGRDEGSEEDEEDEEDEELEFEEKEIEADLAEEALEEYDEKHEAEKLSGSQSGVAKQSAADEKLIKKSRKKLPRIDLPLSLLDDKSGKPTSGDIKANQEIIRKTLNNFGIEVEMGEVSIGPTVTQYTFRPAEGVKLSRIVGLGNDLALALAAHPIRIEAPIPGKSLVGIEVPNKRVALVPLKKVLMSEDFKQRKNNMYIALGQDVAGRAWMVDLTKLPHLLVAGSTNSGKTVCLNSIIISLLYQNQPSDLKLILVDPKRVEMPIYNGIPHLITPVITDVKKTINALKWTIAEMDRRFHILSNAGKRNIQSYNAAHPQDKLPYLVFIIDELADLMSSVGAEVEAAIIRLAQMSRAVGIHLILATQRPSVDIITGLIKTNIPGRIAFSVSSLVDSRTILDSAGAEKLLGRGDMLYSSPQVSKPKRLQGAFCSDDDIERVVAYLREHSQPDYEEGVTESSTSMGLGGLALSSTGADDEDELLGKARELVIEAGKASASYLQRRLRIGYARAARLLDILEEKGVVGPADGSKPREVLVKKGEKSLTEQADELLSQHAVQVESEVITNGLDEQEKAGVNESLNIENEINEDGEIDLEEESMVDAEEEGEQTETVNNKDDHSEQLDEKVDDKYEF